MKRNVALLATCQALLMTAASILIATSALVGAMLSPNPALATVPLGMQFIATMTFTLPASLLMGRIGRRAGFLIGSSVGTAGAIVCALSLHHRSFVGFAAGAFLLGIFTAFGQYYRFAAADAATEDFRARAISLVMAGGLVAAFLGPNLARYGQPWSADTPFLGSMILLCLVIALSMGALAFVQIPRPAASEREGPRRAFGVIARQPIFVVAAFGAMVGYGVMNLVMTATPLAMHAHHHSFPDTAFVIQWHLVGMFAPSFFTGELIRRFGVLNVMLAGAVLLAVCVGVNLSGTSLAYFWTALLLLGVGWNFLFIGGTTLLTEAYLPAEKAVTQGANDLLVFSTVAATALGAGFLHHYVGWKALNLGVLPVLVAVVVAILWLRRKPPEARSATVGG